MFLFRSEKPRTGPNTLSTTQPSAPGETDDARKARHLATLKRIAELGMKLLERAAEEAEKAPPEPAPQKPGQATRPANDPRLVFARLSRDLRETMALEARLAAGKLPAAPPPREKTPAPPDPRRPAIMGWLHTEIAAKPRPKPESTALLRQIETRLTEYLAEDPGLTLPGAVFINEICEEFGLVFNTRTMDDELLLRPGQPFPTYTPNQEDDEDDDGEGEFSLHGPDPP